jgi:hypothetical protein
MLSWMVQFVQMRIPALILRLAGRPHAGGTRVRPRARQGHFPRIISTRSRFGDEGRLARNWYAVNKFGGGWQSLHNQVNDQQARRKPVGRRGRTAQGHSAGREMGGLGRGKGPGQCVSRGVTYQT